MDFRTEQARRLWQLGFGRARKQKIFHDLILRFLGWDLSKRGFDQYLSAIPEIPDSLLTDDDEFRCLVLVDPRQGLTKSCELAGVRFAELGYGEHSLLQYSERDVHPADPFWARVDDGEEQALSSPAESRETCQNNVYPLTAMVAVMLFLQYKLGELKASLVTPGSVSAEDWQQCFCLRLIGEPELAVYGTAWGVSQGYVSGRYRLK